MNLPEHIHKPLIETFKKFRDEELEHFNASIENDAQKAPFHSGLNLFIKEHRIQMFA